VGAEAMSAEAVRLGGVDMSQLIQRKKPTLIQFEKELWKRIIVENNKRSGASQIPEGTELILDFKPDSLHFSSAADEVTFFNAVISNNVMTPIDWIRSRNPELSEEDAELKYEDNKTFNKELTNKVPQDNPIPLTGTPDEIVNQDLANGNPLPIPGQKESKDHFISRFMGNEIMVKDYSDESQRAAIANSQWKKYKENK
jgi:hypothetical protein